MQKLAEQGGQGAAPWLGACSLFGLALGVGVEVTIRALGGAGNSALALGVLAAAMAGFAAMLGARVRGERWPWLGLVGAVLSALPLKLFLLTMLFK